jgi:hypothetical protein
MKIVTQLPRLATALLVVAAARAAEPDLLLIAVLGVGTDARLALRAPTTGRTAWVFVGGTFEGYCVRSFDGASDTAVLAKAEAEFRLHLADSHVQANKPELGPEQRRQIRNNLRRLDSAADQYYLEHGVTRVTYDQLVGPETEKYIRSIMPVAGEDYRAIQFEQGKPLEVRTAYGAVVMYDP